MGLGGGGNKTIGGLLGGWTVHHGSESQLKDLTEAHYDARRDSIRTALTGKFRWLLDLMVSGDAKEKEEGAVWVPEVLTTIAELMMIEMVREENHGERARR